MPVLQGLHAAMAAAWPAPDDEDVHSALERGLIERAGPERYLSSLPLLAAALDDVGVLHLLRGRGPGHSLHDLCAHVPELALST